MSRTLASRITRSASRQTYYTIRLLVDRRRIDDAYRAYAYFRWVDDVLDAEPAEGFSWNDADRLASRRFVGRQRALLDACLRGEAPADVGPHEAMLVELVRHAGPGRAGLHAYLGHMMLVMEFDADRRGRLVSQAELDTYTHWLAIAVTEGVSDFVGGDGIPAHAALADTAPREDEARYLAASGAHILHMLRDTACDLQAGYVNVPREVLDQHGIGPGDVLSDAYRAWVRSRVQLARAHLDAGRAWLARAPNPRYRLAGSAYIARFEWLIPTLEREDFRLRPAYPEAKSLAAAVQMGGSVLTGMSGLGGWGRPAAPATAARERRS